MASTDAPPPAFLEGVEDFLDALRLEAGLSRNTLAAYASDLTRVLTLCDELGAARWEAIDGDVLVRCLGTWRRQGLEESTLARRLSATRMCLRHLVAAGRLERDPSARIAMPRLRKHLPSVLSAEDVEALLEAAGSADAEGWREQRDRALLEVLYACGARVSEAVGLRTDEIDPSLRVLRLTGKGDKTRIVPVGARARDAVQRWMQDGRKRVPGSTKRPEVFLSRSGRPLDRTNAWRRVVAAARAAGLPPGLSPHTLRHSFASHLIEGGADLRSVQEMLGHASIRTTEVYTHLDGEHVRSLHRLYHPRG